MDKPTDTQATAALSMQVWTHIGQAMAEVERLRGLRQASGPLRDALMTVKQFQSTHFRESYADLLVDRSMGAAARFFLQELYGGQDYAERDRQFARIAGSIERLFPQSVVNTATLLARLHALSEQLDMRMAEHLIEDEGASRYALDLASYRRVWQLVGERGARYEQLQAISALGRALQSHTRVPGLRLALRMMRAPAAAAGLSNLQRVLENGFDTFATLGRLGQVDRFLGLIHEREAAWIEQLFQG